MILFENEVVDYLDNLVFELYNKEYFGFIESSEIFADKIIDFINESIETFPAKKRQYNYNFMEHITFFTNQILIQLGIFSLIKK